MGLSICRSIIEAHDGRLWAENSAEGGAILQFTVRAPIMSEEPETTKQTRSRRYLSVDDR